MSGKFDLVKHYLFEMEMPIVREDAAEELVVVTLEEDGIQNLIIDCEDPILIIEQAIMPVPGGADAKFYQRLLQMNRHLVCGAFVLDEQGGTVIFRDTLQLENLDRNELEGSIKSLELALAEYSSELLQLAGR